MSRSIPCLKFDATIAVIAIGLLCLMAMPAAAEDTGLGTAVDAPDLVWTTDISTKAWTVDTEHAVKGGSAARSNPRLSFGDSKIETTVTGPGTLSFSWDVHSPSSDYYMFSRDGAEQKKISGTDSVWTEESFRISSGEHILTWTYHKGSMGVNNLNGGWLDAVTFTEGDYTDFSANVTTGMAPLAVQWTDLSTGDVSGWDWDFGDGSAHATTQNPVHIYEETGTYDVTLTIQRTGVPETETKTGYLTVLTSQTLAEAVDAPDLTLTTGGDAEWAVETAESAAGETSVRSGLLASSQETWVETTVTGAGTLSFDWKVRPQKVMWSTYGELEFAVDGATSSDDLYTKIRTDDGWHHETFDLGDGEHTLRWTYSTKSSDKPENGGWLDNLTFTPKAVPVPTNLKEALDATDLAWVNTGDKDWTVEVGDGIGGGCARSGTFSADDWEIGFSDLETRVTGPGTLTFSWKVSCDEYYEALYFALDGKDQLHIEGLDETWKDATFEVGPGEHTLKWSYWKNNWNGDESDGKSCGWLDNVSYTQEIVTTFTANPPAGDAPLTVQFTDQSTGNPTAWSWDFGDGTTSDEQNPAHTFEAGTYDVSLTVTRNGVQETGTKTGYIHAVGDVTLAEAVDAPDLAWTTGGNATWSVVKGQEYVDYAAAKSAGALTSGQRSWVGTTVEGPCTLSFDWKVNPGKVSGMPLGKMEFAVDDADEYDDLYEKIQWSSDWSRETYRIGHGTHTVAWTYSTLMTDAAENGGWLDNVTYTYGGGEPIADVVTNVTEDRGMAPLAVQFIDNSTGFPTAWDWDFGDGTAHAMTAAPVHVYRAPGKYPVTLTVTNIVGRDGDGKTVLGTDTVTKTVKVIEAIPLGTAADASELAWETGGDADWSTDIYCAQKGGSSARSGVISSTSNTSWIEAAVTGPGVLTFNWNINATAFTYSGLLEFSADGTKVSAIEGTREGKSWPGVYYEVPPGEHALRWTYTNEYRYGKGDCGHLDNVTYTSGAIQPTAVFEANVTRSMAPATVQFNDTSAGCPTAWSWDFGDGKTSDEQNPVHTFEEVGAYTVTLTVTNDAGTGTATETITVVPFATLPEAVEAPDIEWSTGGDAPWFVDVDCVHTGATSGRSGAIGSSQQSWLQANITGTGILTFAWNVSSEPRHDYLRLFIDGEEETNIFGFPETWSEEEYRLGFGTHAVRWVYEKDSNQGMMEDCGWLDNVTFTPVDDTDFAGNVTRGEVPLTVDFTGYSTGNPTCWAWDFGDEESAVGRNQTHTYTEPGVYTVTLIVKKDTALDGQMEVKNGYITVTPTFEEALGAEDLVWTTGGDAPWFVQLNSTFTGGSCGQSGAIKRDQQSWIETTVTGPKNLTFDWQVSSYDSYSMKYSDVLAFSIDGEMQKEIAGKDDGWQDMHYTLDRGEHTLRWTYEKRAYDSYGEDCGRFDTVTLTDIAPVISFAPLNTTIAAGTERKIAVVADHLPDGLKNVSFTVSLENTNARITGVEFAFLAGASGWSGVPGTTITFEATDDGKTVEAGAENVVLATLKVRGITDGMVGITAGDVVIYADNGEETAVICRPGTIDVVGLSPLPGCIAIPGDGDGDGLFEDVNGDGTLDFRDAITYFEHVESVLSQKNPRVFDYNGNGRIDFDDVVTVHRHAGTDRS